MRVAKIPLQIHRTKSGYSRFTSDDESLAFLRDALKESSQ